LEFQYQGIIYPSQYPDLTERAIFFGKFEIYASALGLLIQLIITPKVISRLGVGLGNLIYPMFTGCCSLLLLLQFGFGTGVFAHFVNQNLRGAIHNPLNGLLFNGIPPQRWGAAKAFLSGVIFPISTILISAFLFFAKEYFSLESLGLVLAGLCLILSVLGVLFSIPKWRAYNRGILDLLRSRSAQLEDHGLKGVNCTREIQTLLRSGVPTSCHVALEMIRLSGEDKFLRQVGKLFSDTSDRALRRQCANTLAQFPSQSTLNIFRKILAKEKDPKTIHLILDHLTAHKEFNFRAVLQPFLLHPHPSIFGLAGVALYSQFDQQEQKKIRDKLCQFMTISHNPDYLASTLASMGKIPYPEFATEVIPHLNSPHAIIRKEAYLALSGLSKDNKYHELLLKGMNDSDPMVREAVLVGWKNLEKTDYSTIFHAVMDPSPKVSEQALEIIRQNLSQCQTQLWEAVFRKSNSAVWFELLQMALLTIDQKKKNALMAMGIQGWTQFFQVQAILYWLKDNEQFGEWKPLMAKILQEISAKNLFRILVLIATFSREDRNFLSRLHTAFLSGNKVKTGNAMEALANCKEGQLAQMVSSFYDQNPVDEDELNLLYQNLFSGNFDLSKDNSIQIIISFGNDYLNAILNSYCKEYYPDEKLNQTGKTLQGKL